MITDKNILDLLHHDDLNNRMLGVHLAWAAGYGTIDIFDSLKVKQFHNRRRIGMSYTSSIHHSCYYVGTFKICILSNDFKLSGKILIYDGEDLLNHVNTTYSNHKAILKRFKHMFIEHLLT